jgi:hypothetical protein
MEILMATDPTTNPTRLRRGDVPAYLKEAHGVRVAKQTLAKYALTGDGPAYQRFGKFAMYPVAEIDRWAKARFSALAKSTSELTTANAV